MKYSIFAASLLALTFTAPLAAADNIANCEVILMETIEDESGNGSAQIASYRPAGDFIASVYNDDVKIINDIDGLPVRALLCSRKNVIISDTDFKLLATGVPFILSQNFDSATSDLLTYFFKNGQFQYTHKGKGLSEENLQLLAKRLENFNSREDEIEIIIAARKTKADAVKKEAETKDSKVDETSKTIIEIVEIEPEPLNPVDPDTNIEDDTTKVKPKDIAPDQGDN